MSSPMTRLFLLLAVLCASPLFSGCDFDGAWEGWCARTHCAPAEPDAGHDRCGDCSADEICVYGTPNHGMCLPRCTGYPAACGSGVDCKLVLADDEQHVVPACTATGTALSGPCSSVNDCADQRTCSTEADGKPFCLEICNPYHPDCVLSGVDAGMPSPSCYHDDSMPEGWGVCRQ